MDMSAKWFDLSPRDSLFQTHMNLMCSYHRKPLHLSFTTLLQALFTRNDSTPLPHFKTTSILQDGWLSSNPAQVKCEPRSWPVMSAPHDGGNNQSCEPARCLNRSSGRHLQDFWGARPAERHYILNGNSLVRFPLQLYRHESRKREFPHCSEGLTNGCKRLAVTLWQARVGSCSSNTSRDEDTIWQANKTTTWAHCNRMKWYWGSDSAETQRAAAHSLKSLKV